jgi:UDP-N-acetylmuramoyl-tripeptide--D-alanyl-D-alanine ligase
MAMTTLGQIHAFLPSSKLINISEVAAQSHPIDSISTDSRAIESGSLFIALKGERFDAHQFLDAVSTAGASAALIDDEQACPNQLPAVCVADTRMGLGDFAAAWRQQFALPLVVVTGSNGKTTVKEMIAAIFNAAVGKEATLVTSGNLNNDIGLPLTILRLRDHHRLAVIELGMNHPGETAYLTKIAKPTIALINNAQREHQEFMETVDAVAHEHADAITSLPADGIAVFPADSLFSAEWRKKANVRRSIDFALNRPAAVSGALLKDGTLEIKTSDGVINVRLSVLGEHNLRNALAATAVALAAKVDLEAIRLGLESFQAVSGRMMANQLGACLLIDDSYNANPDSVRAAIDALSQASQKTCLVLGDMGEVGSKGPEFHYEVGAYAAERGIVHLWALGEQTQASVRGFNEFNVRMGSNNAAIHFETIEALNERVATVTELFAEGASVTHPYAVLVKGSRFMRMERVVVALKDTLAEVKACS